MSKPIDTRAFVHRVQPYWADADPAGILYTGRFTDFSLRAIDAWMQDRAGAGFYGTNVDWGIGTPFVRTECDISASVTPRDVLLIGVRVETIGATSLTFRVEGLIESDGRASFKGRFICVCVEGAMQADKPRAIPIDARLKAAAEADLALHGAAGRLLETQT